MGKRSNKGAGYWDNLKGWKAVDTGDDFLLGCEEDGFMGLEELDPSTLGDILLIPGKDTAVQDLPEDFDPKDKKKKKKKGDKKRKQTEPDSDDDDDDEADDDGLDVEQLKAQLAELKAENRALKKQKAAKDKVEGQASKDKKAKQEKTQQLPVEVEAVQPVDVTAWKDFGLDGSILDALSKLGFSTPTHVQVECLPAAIRDRRDVIGAAQTGSGKTLAFGLPILQLLAAQKQQRQLDDNTATATASPADTGATTKSPLRALILAPTRELALQVCSHLKVIGEACGIWVVPIVGGISQQKQERLLSKSPEVVVATPGRLWELMREGYAHLTDLQGLRFLVIDEADRMVQQGHYAELGNIVNSIPKIPAITGDPRSGADGSDEEEQGEDADPQSDDETNVDGEDQDKPQKKVPKLIGMQTFVFSATLTLPTELRKRLRRGGGGSSGSATLENLMDQIPFRTYGAQKPKIVDLTSERKLADKVYEAQIVCPESERDEYLYCLLATHPGRTIVFVNAISSVRRLGAILKILGLPVVALHAGMQQRQRLRALDRFKTDPNGVLIATDVAARGLDVKDVRCVVHYQVPASVDVYVHRSGRTARAEAEGIAIALVTPKESARFRALLRALGKEDVPDFPIDVSVMAGVRERVALAVKVDGLVRKESKDKAEKSWRQMHAEQLDIILSDDELSEEEARVKGKRLGRKGKKEKTQADQDAAAAQKLQAELAVLLSEPLQPMFSKKFFTGGAAAGVAVSQNHKESKKMGKAENEDDGDDEGADLGGKEDNTWSHTASHAVAMAQRLKESQVKAAAAGSKKNNKSKPSSGSKKPQATSRAAALAAELRKREMKKAGKGGRGGGLVVVGGAAFGRDTQGASALQAFKAKI